MRTELGATRKVFVFKRFVIKVPNTQEYRLFLHGILANFQEKLWSGYHADLARVLWCSFLSLVLVMERADVISDDDSLLEQLEAKYADDDLKEFLLRDHKSSNWGYIGNRLVKIDYGN
jgi:hypothetical protein